jgi:two-component system cell cycle sensor histidine kinase PleC
MPPPCSTQGGGTSLRTRIVDSVPEVLFAIADDGTLVYLNPAWTRLTGFAVQDSVGRSYLDFLWREDREASRERFALVLAGDTPDYRHDVRIGRRDGGFRWVTVHVTIERNSGGQVSGTCGSMVDITDRKLMETLAHGEHSVLEAIVGGVPLESVLDRICRLCEEILDHSRCSILQLDPDGVHARIAAAPGLPPGYTATVGSIAIGPSVGSCGAAMATLKPVIVADIANDPLWDGYREHALKHGLKACWSFPIMAEGTVYGAFGIYYGMVHAPAEGDLQVASRLAKLAAVAILRRRNDEAMRRSEQRFRDFTEVASDWLWETDAEFRMTYVSGRVQDTLGIPPAEMLGRRLSEALLQDAGSPKWRRHLDDLRSSSRIKDFEFSYRRPDGVQRCFVVNGMPVLGEDGKVVGYRGTGSDVTAEREATDALRNRKRQLSEAQRITRTGDWLWNIGRDTIDWSDEIYRIFGVSPDAYDPTLDTVFSFVHPDDQQTVIDTLTRSVREKTGGILEYRICRPDGDERHIRAEWLCGLDAGGEVRDVFGVCQDISERKQAEEVLRTAKNKAEAASRAKSEFLASMSHELRTPLNAILGFSEILKEQILGPLSERYRDYAGDIHRSGQHLLDLISDLLNMARIEARQVEFNEETVPLAEVMDEALRLTRLSPGETRHAVELSLPEPMPALLADRRGLKQVLINLLGNAAKFTPDGGRIGVSAGLRDGFLEIAIADTGIGVPKDRIPDLGKPFMRVENVMSQRYQGSGMGLFISKALIERHGGSMRIESAPGEGTTVTMLIPASRVISAWGIPEEPLH